LHVYTSELSFAAVGTVELNGKRIRTLMSCGNHYSETSNLWNMDISFHQDLKSTVKFLAWILIYTFTIFLSLLKDIRHSDRPRPTTFTYLLLYHSKSLWHHDQRAV